MHNTATTCGFSGRPLQESASPRASVWDVLSSPTGDVRGRPYEERRALMLDMVAGLPEGSPIQAVSATEDVEVARVWYETLTGSGVEGVVAKSGRSPYRAGRSSSWLVDCTNPLYAVVWSSIRKAAPCGSGSQRAVGRTRWPGACRPGRSHRAGKYAVPRH
ncbi:hypothetical protein AB0N98_28605 [Streptomyces sp. NPDC093681]|uniref:ATP-dependent DNA ligase n=1 Tax=unclassified Streptomyces TaxID=2593676 RepID=UPI0024B48974|nr:hypothetical protein [Streptomyces sp. V17-9]